MKITVLGAGAWGTALAILLQRDGHAVTIWGHDPVRIEDMRRSGRNERYLPGIELPTDWRLEGDLTSVLRGAECVVVAVPSKEIGRASCRESEIVCEVQVERDIRGEGITRCIHTNE